MPRGPPNTQKVFCRGEVADATFLLFPQGIVNGVLSDTTNSGFAIAAGAIMNENSERKIQTEITLGNYKMVRVTNLGDFQAQPKCHAKLTVRGCT